MDWGERGGFNEVLGGGGEWVGGLTVHSSCARAHGLAGRAARAASLLLLLLLLLHLLLGEEEEAGVRSCAGAGGGWVGRRRRRRKEEEALEEEEEEEVRTTGGGRELLLLVPRRRRGAGRPPPVSGCLGTVCGGWVGETWKEGGMMEEEVERREGRPRGKAAATHAQHARHCHGRVVHSLPVCGCGGWVGGQPRQGLGWIRLARSKSSLQNVPRHSLPPTHPPTHTHHTHTQAQPWTSPPSPSRPSTSRNGWKASSSPSPPQVQNPPTHPPTHPFPPQQPTHPPTHPFPSSTNRQPRGLPGHRLNETPAARTGPERGTRKR